MAALDAQVAVKPWSEQNLARYCAGEVYHALVSVQGEGLLGFILYSSVLDDASIDKISVQPNLQGRGLGAVLLRTALARMAAAGLVRCLLDVRESNAAARALYQQQGFVVDGVRPRYYVTPSGREDALLMSRRL
jgi:ribosomal-protein-alanine N-acetyltransferase